MYQDVITLFNFSEMEGECLWYPTVISHVQLQIGAAARLRQMGPETADAASLHIRFKKHTDSVLIENVLDMAEDAAKTVSKPYIPPKEWAGQKDKAGTLTFAEKKDFFYCGDWTGLTVSDTAYGKKGFYDYMRKNRDNVFLITSIRRCNLIPHFEIGGR